MTQVTQEHKISLAKHGMSDLYVRSSPLKGPSLKSPVGDLSFLRRGLIIRVYTLESH